MEDNDAHLGAEDEGKASSEGEGEELIDDNMAE